MTETDEAELLGDPQSELNGVELTEDEIDTLLEGQDSSERIECSNLSEASCSSAADEVCHAPANDTVSENDNIASESNDSLLEDGEIGEGEQLQKTGNDIYQNDNDLEDNLTICENQDGEVADSTASVLLADNTVKPERTPEQNLNGEVPFLVHDLLNTDEDNDNMAGDDDVCILDLPKDSNHCNGKQLKRYKPSEDDDISITDVLNNGNTSKKQRLVDAEEPDDDVVVEEALPKTSQPNYRFNRIGHQMMRCVIEKFRRENPEALLATYVNNEVQKCQSGLRGMGSKLNQMHKIFINQVEQLNMTWKGKNEQLKSQIDLLTHLKKAPTQNNQIQKPVQPRKSLANEQFVLNQNAYIPRRQKREPASETNSSMSNGQTSWAMPMDVKVFESGNINRTQPQVTDGLIDEVIPDRINIEIPLNPEPRKCYATSPFDSDNNFQLPLRNYPISMEKILSRGISNVQVVINTAYEDFIVSKKLHGQVRYAIPCGTQIEEGSVVRLYFWIESMHTSWTMSKDARVLESGFTKFTMAFNSKQSLFQGDRISLVAFLSVSKSIKFVSGQTTYNMRKPVIKCAIDME